jgi:hypothetical protein
MEVGSDSEFVDVEGLEHEIPRRPRKRPHSEVKIFTFTSVSYTHILWVTGI